MSDYTFTQGFVYDNNDPEKMGKLRIIIPQDTGSPLDAVLHDKNAQGSQNLEEHATGWIPGVFPNFGWFGVPPIWDRVDEWGNPTEDARRVMVAVGYFHGKIQSPFWFGVMYNNPPNGDSQVPPECRGAGEYIDGIFNNQGLDMSETPGGDYTLVQSIRTQTGLRVEWEQKKEASVQDGEYMEGGKDRFLIHHPDGSYIEMAPGGDVKIRANGNLLLRGSKRADETSEQAATAPTGRVYILGDDHVQIDSETIAEMQLEHKDDMPLIQWQFGEQRVIDGPPRMSRFAYLTWVASSRTRDIIKTIAGIP